ncbi:ABC transporter permease [Myceligenerans pegani]|uniref:Molybdate ABC transporter permease subunit n=1 Tax=Myceligenerans pegani TaxID=2776917 RepID=A0ABR9N1Z1_9MICO|nr:ABC transporter permease [Myceligenerans sp. TRM 65318]MBE1877677.1 molybdate ABC transporter permease subunit [Myceligenerans sp. TRM 65318]MBE3019948.1 molybdate ABC transporter permease subunit [Myceligenerans sp. TRM 65318]
MRRTTTDDAPREPDDRRRLRFRRAPATGPAARPPSVIPAGGARRRRDPLGRAPLVLVVPAALAVLLLVVPLITMVLATDPASLVAALGSAAVRDALWLSVVTSTAAIAICLVLGLPLAWVLARVDFPGRRLVRSLVIVPMVLPPVVAGIALRTAFGRSGFLGAPLLDLTGFAFPYTTWGVVLAHVFVALPFVVISTEGGLRAAGAGYDDAAATLGASRWLTFRRVTVPLALPGIAAALVLGWARSLGEFGATITFNGNYPGVTQTMPILVYVERQADTDAVLALSLVMLVVSVGVLVALRDRWLVTA